MIARARVKISPLQVLSISTRWGMAIWASVIGNSDAAADELEAMEIYRFILSHKERYGNAGIRYLSACQHNYATLLHRHNYKQEAARQWQMSYEADANDLT